ncbi:hypothetical protein LTR37_013665 [Vermiconidia calcicola]|uniref:Uncharacterized protein n=1 Tax=Vermiconidia calcicola TaxID=1690605 RepID=A0ACC3MVP3_9PEZI|nr:hypothetical protein LTR37_013665 [Vermiconidia calcicola]
MARFSNLIAVAAAVSIEVAAAADIFAHFMVQNSYAYDVARWRTDMKAAKRIGVDAFALNWVPPHCDGDLSWQADRVQDAFTAAEQMNFKLVHSFDMSWSECDTYWTQTYMQDILSQNAGSSAMYRWNSNILVTTYGGDQVAQYGNAFFQGLKDGMKASSNSITLVPALSKYSYGAQSDPEGSAKRMISDFSSIDGYLNWQAWPLDEHKNMTVEADRAFQSALKKAGKTGPYIMSISPWQYKNLNNGNPWDAWVQYSDTLFPDRFESITKDDAFQPDIIELISWNDWPESHYLRDLPSQDVGATDYAELGDFSNYVRRHEHGGWRIIAKYYISWWKTGKAPKITKDRVVYWYRVHPKDAACSGGTSTAIRNHMYPEDAVFAWALVKKGATISMSAGSNTHEFHADSKGPSMGRVSFPSDLSGGVTPEVAIIRNGKTKHWSKGSQPITDACEWENYNPVVGVCRGQAKLTAW